MSNPTTKKQVAGIQAYQQTEIMTANRETILLMLYGGAIRFLTRAIEASKSGNKAKKCENLTRTQRIICELRSTLNFDTGGELAQRLEALYAFITRQLIHGVMEEDSQGIEEALKVLIDLNDAWNQAVAQIRATAESSKT